MRRIFWLSAVLFLGVSLWLIRPDTPPVSPAKTDPSIADSRSPASELLAPNSHPVASEARATRAQQAGRIHEPPLPASQLNPFLTGRDLKLNGRDWRETSATAVPPDHFRSGSGQVIGKLYGFIVQPSEERGGQELVVHDSARPVVINPATGRPEIISGTLMVKVDGPDVAGRLAQAHGLRLLTMDNVISVAYMRVPDGFPLASGLEALKQDPGVLGVEVEFLRGEVRAK
jgi:hypothetical protein